MKPAYLIPPLLIGVSIIGYTLLATVNDWFDDNRLVFKPIVEIKFNSPLSVEPRYFNPLSEPVEATESAVIETVAPVYAADEIPEVITKTAHVTAYSCVGLETTKEILMNCPSILDGQPQTSSGTTPIPYKTMACDRANMGRTFDIEGIGQVKCTDTGGAIKGQGRFDLYLPTVQEARQFGVQYLSYSEAYAQ